MARRVVVGDLRVQQIQRSDGRRSWTIVWPEGTEHAEADRFLRRHEGSGTQRTYAYVLVDHLRWLERECLTLDTVGLRDLERYMGILGAEVRMPFGEPWRVGKRPYGPCGTVDYGVLPEGFLPAPGRAGGQPRARQEPQPDSAAVAAGSPPQPSWDTRRRRCRPIRLPRRVRGVGIRRCCLTARERSCCEAVHSARDRLVVTWLGDGGLRIGELCGLHLIDLHLREDAACGQCRTPHLHVCHRPDNPNRAEAKTKHPWRVEDGTVTGGLIKRVSPAMIHTYFDYITTEYPRGSTDHGMLLIQLHGAGAGQPWAPVAARRMLARAGKRAGLGVVRPHAFRHSFTSAVLDASGGQSGDRPRRRRLGVGGDGRRGLRPRRCPRPGLRRRAARGVG